MPFMGSHHKIDAHTHFCFHKNYDRHSFSRIAFGFLETFNYLSHIIAIHFYHFPIKSFELSFKISERKHFIGWTVNLFFIILGEGRPGAETACKRAARHKALWNPRYRTRS